MSKIYPTKNSGKSLTFQSQYHVHDNNTVQLLCAAIGAVDPGNVDPGTANNRSEAAKRKVPLAAYMLIDAFHDKGQEEVSHEDNMRDDSHVCHMRSLLNFFQIQPDFPQKRVNLKKKTTLYFYVYA